MSKTTQWIVAILASIAVPCAMAQQMSSDQQIVVPKNAPKMTEAEKKADIEKKRGAAAQAAPKSPNAVVGKDQQVKELKAPAPMTAEEKKADKAAKRKAPTAEEQAKEAKKSPGS